MSNATTQADANQQTLPVSLPDCFADSFSDTPDYAPIAGSMKSQDAAEADSGDWRQEVSARLQAHRSRRAGQQIPAATAETRSSNSRRPRISSRATNAAATVAERYASAPSYSRYLETSNLFPEDAPSQVRADESLIIHGANAIELAPEFEVEPELDRDSAEQTAAGHPMFPSELAVSFDASPAHRTNQAIPAKDQFEQAAVEPAVALPANLIEFPRQLVAARKARPRLAETPQRYDAEAAAPAVDETETQLRIFEVEPEAISTQLPAESAHVPSWHELQFDAVLESPAAHALPARAFDVPLQAAPVSRRIMAGLVDAAIVGFGYLAFVAIFSATATELPEGKPAIIGAVGLLIAFYAAYQWIFFRWSDATPGMRYARIGLCTFNDENPNRSDMQWRLLASALSAAALGLGYIWALVDDDRLAWHDRMSRVYLRCY